MQLECCNLGRGRLVVRENWRIEAPALQCKNWRKRRILRCLERCWKTYSAVPVEVWVEVG